MKSMTMEELIEEILTEAKFFIAIDSKFLLNENTDHILISLSTVDFVNSGLYTDMTLAAKDIRVIMDEYDKRRKTYQHNLNQTNKGIQLLMNASSGILDKYPEAFI
jgi:hypothetical protein